MVMLCCWLMRALAFIRRQQDTGCKNFLNKHPEMAPRDVQLILGGVSIESVIIQGHVSQALSEELWVQRGATHILCHRITRELADKNHISVSSATSTLLCGDVMKGCDTVSYPFQRRMLCLCTRYNCIDL